MTNILIQILLILAIAVACILIVVLLKWNSVLVDIMDTTKIAKKRAKDIDQWLSQAESTIKDFSSSFKSFLNTFEQLKNIKNKMTTFLAPDPVESNAPKNMEIKKEE